VTGLPTGRLHQHHRQWRRAGIAFAAVALATGVVAGVEMSKDDPSAGASRSPSAGPTSSAASGVSPTPTPTTSPSVSVSPGGAADPTFRCWTGRAVTSADRCPEPTGPAGLAWVFPSFDADSCTDLLAARPSPRLRQLYECEVDVAGTPVTVDYAEWRSVADAVDYYDSWGTRRVTIRGAGGRPLRFGWLDETPGGSYLGALAYTDAPYSVSLTAPDEATRTRAAHDAIRLRPTSELGGVPIGG
jgi:hypothetical protein